MSNTVLTQIMYTVFTNTLCQGSIPTITDGDDRWVVFDTEREAQLEIIDSLEERIHQFKDGQRDYDDAIEVDEYVVAVYVMSDGSVTEVETGQNHKVEDCR